MIAKKIKKIKDNISPGIDGIPPKLLKEIVEQISTLLLEEGILRRYLGRDRETNQKITDQ